jgi:hypothetical protein
MNDQHPTQPAPRPYDGWRVEHIGFAAPKRVEIFSYDEGELWPDQFRVETLFCGLSSGTELTHFLGTNPYFQSRWDDWKKLFVEGDGHDEYPMRFSGYMQVGRVVASRFDGASEGEIVAMSYGHKSGHTVNSWEELWFPLPREIDPVLGVYVGQMGPICANGILHADEEAFGSAAWEFGCGVKGQTVFVGGTGVVGFLTALMCRRAGASEVAIAGRNAGKLRAARELGLIPVDTTQTDPGQWCKTRWHNGQGVRGADVAFQCTGSDEMLSHCLRTLAPQRAVIDLGFYQAGAPSVQFGREFHHNGLKHICAQIERVPRKLSAHWDRRRLAAQTLELLQSDGEAIKEHLITHRFRFDEAQSAFDLLSGASDALQVVLECEPKYGDN